MIIVTSSCAQNRVLACTCFYYFSLFMNLKTLGTNNESEMYEYIQMTLIYDKSVLFPLVLCFEYRSFQSKVMLF